MVVTTQVEDHINLATIIGLVTGLPHRTLMTIHGSVSQALTRGQVPNMQDQHEKLPERCDSEVVTNCFHVEGIRRIFVDHPRVAHTQVVLPPRTQVPMRR